MATDAPPPKRPKPDGSHVDTCGTCRFRLGAPVEAGPWSADMKILACARCPRAFHARCLGLSDMEACAPPTTLKLPWIDPQGRWLCGAKFGDSSENEFVVPDVGDHQGYGIIPLRVGGLGELR